MTIPPAHGPQLNETTRQCGIRTAARWAHLLRYSFAAAYATWPGRPNRAVDDEKRTRSSSDCGLDRPEHVVQALDLGLVDQIELRIGLIGDLAIGEDAGAVDQAAHRAELLASPGEGPPHFGLVPYVNGAIDDRRAGLGDPCEGVANLAGGHDLTHLLADRPGRREAIRSRQQGSLQLGFVVEVGEGIVFGDRLGAAAEQQQPRLERSRQGDGYLGGDPPRTPGDHHQVAATEPGRSPSNYRPAFAPVPVPRRSDREARVRPPRGRS